MSESIAGLNLIGKTVLVKASALREPWASRDRLFFCDGAFGCNPNASGTKCFGYWVADGNTDRGKDWIRRSDVEEVIK